MLRSSAGHKSTASIPLSSENLRTVARRALESERGLADFNCSISPDALDHLVQVANGDARVLLNVLEFAALTAPQDADGKRLIELSTAEEAAQMQRVRYDKSGDNHYDVISAFIKSLRGSDPDAALYWYARMVYADEDPPFYRTAPFGTCGGGCGYGRS